MDEPAMKLMETLRSSRTTLITSLRACPSKSISKTQLKMVKNLSRQDPELFAQGFFPHLLRLDFNRMHRAMFGRRALEVRLTPPDREGRRSALAAPRGAAKSTIQSLLFPLHDLCYGREHYIVIFSATLPQAELRLKNIRRELEKNNRLKDAFGEVLAKPHRGAWSRRSIEVGAARIEAYSAGTEARGISFGEWRPTAIILDDIEDSELVENAEYRERLADWFHEVVENLGDRYTNIDVVGTVLHPDSLLARLLERPDFISRRWRAVDSFADRADLWEQWQQRYMDLSNSRRQSAAKKFFLGHEEEMLRGARVLWPEKEDYYELMVQLATRGRRAFFKEKQNEPIRADSAVFDPSTFRFFRRAGDHITLEGAGPGSAIPLSSLRVVGFLDSAMGRGQSNRRGDFAAIATVGADPSGRLFALDVWLSRATPTEQAERVWAQHDLWNYSQFGIEAVGFQGLIAEPIDRIRRTRRAAGLRADLALSEIQPQGAKELRVAALEPLVHNGLLLFDRALPEEFFAQLEQFPRGKHDDGPDALAAAADLARSNAGAAQTLGKRRHSAAGRY